MQRPFVPRVVAVSVWIAMAASALAQNVGTPPGSGGLALVTPGDLAPRRIEIGTDPALLPPPPPAPRQLARPDDEVRLKVLRYEVDDSAPAALRQALPGLTARFTGESRSFGDLTNAAREVTRHLQSELGYYLGLAYIPEQDAQDGVVRIAVLEGRLDRIELLWPAGLPVGQAVVEQYLAQIKPGEVLMARDVERMVFLLNDLRGISAEFEVVPGTRPGTARLIVRPRATPRLAWSADLDNANATDLGRYRVGAGLSWGSPFGRGDVATASLIASEGMGFALGSYTSPIGAQGWRVGGSVSMLEYRVIKGEFAGAGIKGQASTASLYTLYPLRRGRDLNLFVNAYLDAKRYDDASGAISTRKQVNTAALGLTGDLRDSVLGGALNSLDLQLTQGEVTFATAPAVDAPDRRFGKLMLRFVRLQGLPAPEWQLYTAVRVQAAFNNLDVTEQFRIGGPDGVRAFSAGQGSGDSGMQATIELRWLLPDAWLSGRINGRGSLAAFVDSARVQRRHNASTQLPGFVNYDSYAGAGLALQWDGPNDLSLRASAAGQFEAPRDATGRFRYERSPRIFVQVRKQF